MLGGQQVLLSMYWEQSCPRERMPILASILKDHAGRPRSCPRELICILASILGYHAWRPAGVA